MTIYQEFVEVWKDCQQCNLCETRRKVVLARGTVPCDVLFVGEAPGESEDVIGLPFVGPAGKMLDSIIEDAFRSVSVEPGKPSYALTNIVCCIPRDAEGNKVGEPSDEAVTACRQRLVEFVRLCDPRLIVCVGTVARDWLDLKRKRCIRFHRDISQVSIHHPAFILRMNAAQQGLAAQKCVVTIANALEEL